MSIGWARNRVVVNSVRIVSLCALVVAFGVLAGVALGVPLGRFSFSSSDSVRLDQAQLVGKVEPEAAIVAAGDLPVGWKEGDPGLAAFGILGSQFCGAPVEVPTATSDMKSSVFTDPNGDGTLISQAVRVEKWYDAREYVRDVERAISDCDKFFQPDFEGGRSRIDVRDSQIEPPITDFVSRAFVSEDGSGVQVWSMMAIGDVIVGIRHLGDSSPQRSLIPDALNRILMRTVPGTFTSDVDPGAEAATSTSVATTTTVIESGNVDEEFGEDGVDGSSTPDSNTTTGGGTTDDEGGYTGGDEPRD